MGICVSANLKSSIQCCQAANRANRILGLLKRSITGRRMKILVPLYKCLVRPHLEYVVQAWAPHLKQDINTLERVQHRFTRLFPGIRHLPYEERLQKLNIPSLVFRRLRGDLIEVFKMVKGYSGLDFDKFFSFSRNHHTRGHSLKLTKMPCTLNSRQCFFSNRVVDVWNDLTEDVVQSSSVNIFKSRVDQLGGRSTGAYHKS